MKKILITLLLLAVPSMTLAFDVNLKQGSRGEEVKKVQKFLGVEETGYFGVLTKKAVIAFQKEKGLPAFGFWYGMTRAEAKKGVEQVATSTPVVASSTVVATPKKEVTVTWNAIKTVSLLPNRSDAYKIKYEFTPITSDGKLLNVSKCEITSYHYLNESITAKTESKSYLNGYWFEDVNGNQKATVKCHTVNSDFVFSDTVTFSK